MDKRLMLSVCVAPLVAAGPVGEGRRTTVGLGYLSTEQLELRYTAREAVVLLEHTAQSAEGWTVSAEGSTAIGPRDYGDAVPPWQPGFSGVLAVRGGYHGQYGGIELGPGWWLDPTISGITISTNLWLGPRVLHGWVSTWPGSLIGDIDTARVGGGLGHHGERIQAQVGRWAGNFNDAVILSGQVDAAVSEDLWVGLRARAHSGDWSGLGQERRVVLTASTDLKQWVSR